MVKPGSIIGGFIIALSIATQVITLVELANYYWLLFIWVAGLIAGVTYYLGGVSFETDKMEYFTISGIGLGAIGAITAYFSFFQGKTIYEDHVLAIHPTAPWWLTLIAIGLSAVAAFLVAIAPLFIAAGAGKQLKGVKPGAIIGGILISGSLTLQIITIIHFAKYYYLLFFWFIGLIGAIALAAGARAKWSYSSSEFLVTAGVFIGILLVLVIWWTVSPQMKANIYAKTLDVSNPLGNLRDVLPTVISFISGLVAFFGVLFCSASSKSRAY
ncbi:MAG TPA: hypothetical protein VMZ29_09905 [Candidatus Bathyarchaeia archaeon]|nr:hypothetical protein [Candidatus Bathyarchaeia archaeon]